MPLLEVHNLTKRFGGLVAVNNVSFHIEEGEILGLIGPNGAGKTTLFNLITNLISPDSGTVKFDGTDITRLKPHEICRLGIARTFQIMRPFHDMSVFYNVLVGALCKTESLDEAEEETSRVLDLIGLKNRGQVKARNLTAADLKFLEMARALATKPKLLLLDELVAGLNPVETEKALSLLKKIRDMGVTLCLVEHVMGAVMSVSNRIIVLNEGSVIAEGTPREISKNSHVIEVYLGEGYAGN
ncbi:MAG: ABC transporter ATP-binding protein [Candidatus Bathyarchaeia archaeon]